MHFPHNLLFFENQNLYNRPQTIQISVWWGGALGFWDSMLYCEAGCETPKRLYLALRASTRNRDPAGINRRVPTQANPYDQLKSLCCQYGIQSRLSPFAPNILTEIKPHMPAKICKAPLLKSSKMNLWNNWYTNINCTFVDNITCRDRGCRSNTAKWEML